LTFRFNGLAPAVTGNIDPAARTVTATVPGNTDRSSLVPTITLSEGAVVSPAPGTARDFRAPVTYTVTAEDGSQAVWTVTVSLAGGSATLTGSVSLPGFIKVGVAASAITDALNGTGALSYQWEIGGSATTGFAAISGATGASYTPVAADEGKYLRVLVNRAGYTGGVTSAAVQVQGANAEPPTVTGVTVTAAASSVAKGGAVQFSAVVAGTGNPSQAVTWTIDSSGGAAGTGISGGGLLSVAAEETAASITVRATSTVDTSKSGTASVTVTGSGPGTASSLTISGLPGSGTFAVYVFTAGTDVSSYTAVISAWAASSWQAVGATLSGGAFPLIGWDGSSATAEWTGSGTLPVVLLNGSGSITESGNPMYSYATVSFTEGAGTASFGSFTALVSGGPGPGTGGSLTINNLVNGNRSYVFNPGTDLSTFNAIISAYSSSGWQAVGAAPSGNAFTLIGWNGSAVTADWAATGTFPVLLIDSGGSILDSGSAMYRSASVSFTGGVGTAAYSSFIPVVTSGGSGPDLSFNPSAAAEGLYAGGASTRIDVSGQTGDDLLTQAMNYLQGQHPSTLTYYTIVLEGSYVMPSTATISDPNIVVTLAGKNSTDISRTTHGYFFNVAAGNLVLGNNITLKGHANNTAALVYVSNSGVLTMKAGAKIIDNQVVSGNSGGVFAYGGSFIMEGGVISGNSGGVFVYGSFTMKGGEISGNTAAYYGGGVGVAFSGSFIMEGGEISDNTAPSGGGGVYLDADSSFIMEGGKISGNTAAYSGGGGVYLRYSDSSFIMEGGEISGNTANGPGGGGGADDRGGGGGVYILAGNFSKTGGTIYGDTDGTPYPDNGNSYDNTAKAGNTKGHAVFHSSGSYYRDSTLNTEDDISNDDLSTPPWNQ
jgi:hypothetical protein